MVGELLGSRCVLESEGEEEDVVQGLTSHMEMCDFFLFFYIDIKGLTLAQVKPVLLFDSCF